MAIACATEENPAPTEQGNEPEETPEETNESKLEEYFKILRKNWNKTQSEARETSLIGSIAKMDEEQKKDVLECLTAIFGRLDEFVRDAYEQDSAKMHIARFEDLHFKGFGYNKEIVFEQIRNLTENIQDLQSLT